MTKRQVIDEILAINQTANPGFLARFDDDQLRQYLAHLNVLRQPRIPHGEPGRYDKYFRNCPAVPNRPAWRTGAAQRRADADDTPDPAAPQNAYDHHAAASPQSASQGASSRPPARDDAPAAAHDLAPPEAKPAAAPPDSPAPTDPELLPLAVTAGELAEAARGGPSAPSDPPDPVQPVPELVEPPGHVSEADLTFRPAPPAEEFPIVGLGAVVSAVGVLESQACMGDATDASGDPVAPGDIVHQTPLANVGSACGLVAAEPALDGTGLLLGQPPPPLAESAQGPSVSGPLLAAAEPQDHDSWLY